MSATLLLPVREGLPLTRAELAESQGRDLKTTGMGRTTGTEGEIHARQKVTLIAGALFPANSAVNRLRAEVAVRRLSEHQRYVRKFDLRSSRYANRHW